jgi:hypothetical protein
MRPTHLDRKHGSTNRPSRRIGGAAFVSLVACAAAIAVAGCGGSGATTTGQSSAAPASASGSVSQTASTAASAQTHTTQHSTRGAKSETARREGRVLSGNAVQRPAPGTGGGTLNDDNTKQVASHSDSGTQVFGNEPNPCRLVPQADAESIIGQPIGVPRMVPLGPTCLYQTHGARSPITLSVQVLNFSKIEPHMRKVTRLRIRGLNAYCGTYGRPMTFVPLGRTVLNVTAPCSVGALMAAEAVSRLTA